MRMIGIQRKKLANWLTRNIDLTITLAGVTVIIAEKQFEDYRIRLESIPTNIEFWTLFFGVVVLSIGITSVICYRIILKWNNASN